MSKTESQFFSGQRFRRSILTLPVDERRGIGAERRRGEDVGKLTRKEMHPRAELHLTGAANERKIDASAPRTRSAVRGRSGIRPCPENASPERNGTETRRGETIGTPD